MAKIERKLQKIFGVDSGATEVAQFGSLAAGSPLFSKDPEVIQALSNYLDGWFAGVEGAYSPAIEDMNALCYLFAYQLSYLMQTGLAEWNDETTYYIGSLVNDGLGNIYASEIDDNLNQALTDATKWRRVNGSSVQAVNPAVTPTVTLVAADNGKIFNVNTANGACAFNLPTGQPDFQFTVKDVGGLASLNAVTLVPNGAQLVEGLNSTYSCDADFGAWTLTWDGTNWYLAP